ncbi:hypothetical protein DRT95_25925, partial [Salmonella enterica subsp. enterica]|nr:hypothetical protein [Salmonella enterica subsp. enterica serovar Stanley]
YQSVYYFIYPSYFKWLLCWLRITRPIHGPRPDGPLLTPVTSLSMLPGTHSLAAFKQLELFWVYIPL